MLSLLLALLFCHFLADFTPLSTPWMLQAKLVGRPWWPIMAHAAVHGLLMGLVLLFFTNPFQALLLAIFQTLAHFLTDLPKGRLSAAFTMFREPGQKAYWGLFGADQLCHQVAIVAMVHHVYTVWRKSLHGILRLR